MSDLKSAEISIWKESFDASSFSAIGFILELVYTLLLVKVLPQQSVGVFFFYLAIVFLIIQISKGIGIAVRKHVSSISKERTQSKYFWSGVCLLFPILAIIMVCLFSISMFFDSHLPINITFNGFLSILFASLGISIMELGRLQLAGSGEPGKAEKHRVLIGKTSMLLLTTLLLLYPSAELAISLRGLGFAVSGFVMINLSPHMLIKPDKKSVLDVLRFSKWSIPTNLLNDFYHRWDTLLLGIMVGAISISYYDSSVRIATIGFPLMIGISSAANVKLSGLYESNQDFETVFSKILTVSPLFAYPFLIVFFFSGEYILSVIFGPEYIPAAMMLFLLSIQQVFQSFRLQFEALFNSIDSPKETTKTSGVSVLVNVATAPILVLEFGAIGVLYSTLLSEAIRLVLYEYQSYSKLNTIFINKAILLQPILIIILSVCIKIVSNLYSLTPKTLFPISLLSIIVFYILLYFTSTQIRHIFTEIKQELI